MPLKPRPSARPLGSRACALLATSTPPSTTPPGTPPGQPPVSPPSTPTPPILPPTVGFNGPEVVEEKQALRLTGTAAVAELEGLKARIGKERDLELTISWRLERKGTKL